ncbi:hypothetical protein DFH11DRAFT_1567695 [Phellopilus nigrolimitatus]|nr:hypothetical protein DFH11DRAFT_1567695 [Phellopilus nigrolimitatus]
MPSSSYIPQTQASGSNLPSLPIQSMFGYKNLAQESVREPHARDPHLPYRQSASVCLGDTPHPSKAGISSPVSPNFSSPPRYPAWPQTSGMPSHVQNPQINHNVAPAIHIGSQKRSATASDLSENPGGMKRARQETSENQASGATSSQLHEAIAARKTAEKALEAERKGWHAERSCTKQAWKKDLDRLSKARETDVQKRNDLEKQVEELHVELRTLRETLTTAQEDYQKTARHNQELRAAAEEAMRNERRLAGENARLIDAERVAREAQERAEESRISVMEIQKAAEEALASERCRRMAAEQALLDVTSVLNGVDAMTVCPRP